MIGSNHEIVLSDFGIAVVAHSTYSRKVEDIIGTWTYAARRFWGHRIPRRISTRWLSSPTNDYAESTF